MGPFDAVIHNAGVIDGPGLLPVNVVAPYALHRAGPGHAAGLPVQQHAPARFHRPLPRRLVRERKTLTYSDSKLWSPR